MPLYSTLKTTYIDRLVNELEVADELGEGLLIGLPSASDEDEQAHLHGPPGPGYLLQHVLQDDLDARELTEPRQHAKVEQPVHARAVVHDDDAAAARPGVSAQPIRPGLVKVNAYAAHTLQHENGQAKPQREHCVTERVVEASPDQEEREERKEHVAGAERARRVQHECDEDVASDVDDTVDVEDHFRIVE